MKLPAYQELSKEQDAINNLPLDKSYLVTGPPGTGKTVMALYRSKMLTEQNVPATLLMHSRLLSQYTNTAVKKLDIDGAATTFHSWVPHFYKTAYGAPVPKISEWVFDWDAILRRVGRSPPPATMLEHLIVDEGQDLDKRFYPVASHISKCVTVFADENQRLTENNSTIRDIKAYGGFHASHELRRNYRNTSEIARLASHFTTGLATGTPEPPTRHGEPPVLQRFRDLNASVEAIYRYEKNNPDLHIGVFVPYKKQRDSIFNRLSVEGRTANKPQRYDSEKRTVVNFESPGVVCICYNSAKGLEFDTVFMPELQDFRTDIHSAEFKMKFYVLTSRARTALFLSYSGEEEPRIVQSLPKELIEWR